MSVAVFLRRRNYLQIKTHPGKLETGEPSRSGAVLALAYVRRQAEAGEKSQLGGTGTRHVAMKIPGGQAFVKDQHLPHIRRLVRLLSHSPQTALSVRHDYHHFTAVETEALRRLESCPESHRSPWGSREEAPTCPHSPGT